MKKINFARVAGLLGMMAMTLSFSACSDDEETPQPEVKENRILALDEIKGVWNSPECLFDIHQDGTFYETDPTYGPPLYDGYVHDENGDYVTLTTAEYCEQYAADYNADPKNTDKFTAEDAASRTFASSFINRFTVSDDQFLFEQGNPAGLATIIRGTYTYDAETGLFTVTNDFGEQSVSKVYVFEDATDGVTKFLVVNEFFPYKTTSYDGKKEYYPLCPIYYFCTKS